MLYFENVVLLEVRRLSKREGSQGDLARSPSISHSSQRNYGSHQIGKAYEYYLRTEAYKEASILMRNRFETSAKNGIHLDDTAQYEFEGAIAIIVNTAPAAFWMLFLDYSYPDGPEGIRKEVDPIVATANVNGD